MDLLTISVLLSMEIGTLRTSNVTMSSTVMNVIGSGGCCGSFGGSFGSSFGGSFGGSFGAGGAGGARGRGCVGDVEDADWKADTVTTASSTTASTTAAHTHGLLGNHVVSDSFPSPCDGRTSTNGVVLVGSMARDRAASCFGVLPSVPTYAVRPLSDKVSRGRESIVPPKDTPLLLLPARLATRSSNRSENSAPLLLGRRRRVVFRGCIRTDIAPTRLVQTLWCRTNHQQTSVFKLQHSPVRPNDTSTLVLGIQESVLHRVFFRSGHVS